MKRNKVHDGKEFQSSFRYVGQVLKHISGIKEESKIVDFFTEKVTEVKGVPMRQAVFQVATAKYNKLKVELNGFEQELVYPYSSKHKKSAKVKWVDRFNKDKYPDKTYHLIDTPWDTCQNLGDILEEDIWVEVRGEYVFDKYVDESQQEHPVTKRIIKSVNIINPKENTFEEWYKKEYKKDWNKTEEITTELQNAFDGWDNEHKKVSYINSDGKEIEFEYICDFDDPNFKEINTGFVELGVRSTYQDEDTGETKVNAVYMSYGKEASLPKEFELDVCKPSLANAFAKLNRGDFVKVQVVDNNRPIFSKVESVDKDMEDNPFADLDEEDKVVNTGWAISGNKKGLEIIKQVTGEYVKGMLSEDELAGVPSEEEKMPWMED